MRVSRLHPKPASMRWVSVIGASVAAFLALATASSTYLSMLTHGHSFVRLLGWQLGCWSFWAIVAPWVVRVSGRQGFWRLAGLGVALTVLHTVVAAALAIWLQPFFPVVSYDFGRALANLWWFPLLVDPLVFGLLVVGRPRACSVRACPTARASRIAARGAADPRAARRPATRDSAAFSVQHAELDRGADPGSRPRRRAVDAAGVERSRCAPRWTSRRAIWRRSAARCTLIRQYVDLQRVRFGDRLNVAYQVDAACEAIDIPTSAAAAAGRELPCVTGWRRRRGPVTS